MKSMRSTKNYPLTTLNNLRPCSSCTVLLVVNASTKPTILYKIQI